MFKPLSDFNVDEFVKSRHSREGGNPGAHNFLKRIDSRLRTSGMTTMKRTFCDVVDVVAKFKAETSASSSVSSRLPVILLQKSSHIPSSPMSIIYADISV